MLSLFSVFCSSDGILSLSCVPFLRWNIISVGSVCSVLKMEYYLCPVCSVLKMEYYLCPVCSVLKMEYYLCSVCSVLKAGCKPCLVCSILIKELRLVFIMFSVFFILPRAKIGLYSCSVCSILTKS